MKAKITSSGIHTNNVHHSYFVYRTPMGRVTIGCDGSALTHVAFGIAEFEGECRACTLTNEASSQILEYLAQKRTTFSLPLNPRGTDFQKKVWEYVLAIPYGQTRTYAVSSACSHNPLPFFIPSHRVIGMHGDMGGFVTNPAVKQFLISLEARNNE